jgi:hypothetical protein
MSNSTKYEDRTSSSPSTHEGEPSESLCDRLSRTRDTSQRQLPTDHDYAVSTREYQTDQSSLKPALTAAGPVLEKQRQNKPPDSRGLTRSLHIRDLPLIETEATSYGHPPVRVAGFSSRWITSYCPWLIWNPDDDG